MKSRIWTLSCFSALFAGGVALAAPPEQNSPWDAQIRSDLSLHEYREILPVISAVEGESDDGVLIVAADFDGLGRSLLLRPHSVRADDFVVLQDDGAGLHPIAPPAPTTYRGEVRGLPGSVVTASIIPDPAGGPPRLIATIELAPDGDPAHKWHIEPWQPGNITDAHGPLVHVAFRADEQHIEGLTCGADEFLFASPFHGQDDQAGPAEGGLRGVTSCNRVCQIAFDTDFEFYTANGSTSAATIADIEAVMNGVQTIYQRDCAITYSIGTIIVRSTSADPYTSFDAGTMLSSEFRNGWIANQAGVVRDVAHMYTGKDFTGSTIGIAYLSGICNSVGYGCTQRYGGVSTRTAICAHELGHNWSAPHCDSSPDCSIMCSGLGGCAGNTTSFSSTSISSIVSYKNSGNAGCLSQGANIPPYTAADSAQTLERAAVTIDVLANDFSSDCESTIIASFDAAGVNGGAVTRSVGTGPGGRDRLIYTPPQSPAPLPFTDSFTYLAGDGTDTTAATVSIQNISYRPPENPASTLAGLDVAYYALTAPSVLPNFALLTPSGTDTTTQINVASTSGNFMTSGRADDVGAVLTGYLTVPTTGLYTLSTESDDGSRLLIGSTVVVDNDGLHGMTTVSGTLGLQAGTHALRVEFFERTSTAGLIARIQGPGIALQVIPASMLRRPATAAPFDLCSGATVVVDGTTPFTTVGAATDGPAHACLPGDGLVHNDVWFRYNATVTGTMTAGVCGAPFDTRLAIYQGSSCGSLATTFLACNDNACGAASQLTVNVTAGISYLIRVGGASAGLTGAATLSVSSDPAEVILACFTTKTAVPGLGDVPNEDIVALNTTNGLWARVFDGSDIGLSPVTIDALAILPGGGFLLSFTADLSVPGLIGGPNGTLVDDADIIQYTPGTLGSVTSGTLTFYFDGSDVGLDDAVAAEDIDALAIDGSGKLYISTTGTNNALGVNTLDEDILVFTPTSLGAATAGSWAMYFDGSDVGLSTTADEDIDAVAFSGANLLFSTFGDFAVTGLAGVNDDVAVFTPTTTGPTTAGSFSLLSALNAAGIPATANLNALEYTSNPVFGVNFQNEPAAPPACAADVNEDGALDSGDFFDFLDAFLSGTAGPADPDFNGDDQVNSDDYQLFVEAFFSGCN